MKSPKSDSLRSVPYSVRMPHTGTFFLNKVLSFAVRKKNRDGFQPGAAAHRFRGPSKDQGHAAGSPQDRRLRRGTNRPGAMMYDVLEYDVV